MVVVISVSSDLVFRPPRDHVLERIEVCVQEVLSWGQRRSTHQLLTFTTQRARTRELKQPRVYASLMEPMFALTGQHPEIIPLLKVNNANGARLSTDRLRGDIRILTARLRPISPESPSRQLTVGADLFDGRLVLVGDR